MKPIPKYVALSALFGVLAYQSWMIRRVKKRPVDRAIYDKLNVLILVGAGAGLAYSAFSMLNKDKRDHFLTEVRKFPSSVIGS